MKTITRTVLSVSLAALALVAMHSASYGQVDPTTAGEQPVSIRSATPMIMDDGSVVELDRMVSLHLPNSNKVVLKFMFLNGSSSDPEMLEGLTFLTANWIADGGTQDLSSTKIKDFLYPMAASTHVSVDKEAVVFTFEFHKDFVGKVYPVVSDLIYSPRFDEADFARVKSNQQNYVDEVIKASSDEEYSKKALEERLFRDSRYGHLKQGYSESIERISMNEAMEHYQNYFTAGNVIVGLAGNFSEEFLAIVAGDIQRLPMHEPPVADLVAPSLPEGIQVEIISKQGALGSAIYTGTPLAITRANDDFAALMVANSWLGEHRKSYSRLYQKIRQQRSMNYGDYSYIEWYENGGRNMLPVPGYPRSLNYFALWIRPVQTAGGLKQQILQEAGVGSASDLSGDQGGEAVSEDVAAASGGVASEGMDVPDIGEIELGHAHFALRMAIRELDKLVAEGMSLQDFELTREFLLSYMKLYIQTPARQLGYLMDSRYYGRFDYLSDMEELIMALTLEEVNKAIKKYWHPQKMHVTIVTDELEAESLSQSLMENRPSPMTYSLSLKKLLPQDILDEDKQVAEFHLNVVDVRVTPSEIYFTRKAD